MNIQGQLDKNVTSCLGFLNEANDAKFKTTQSLKRICYYSLNYKVIFMNKNFVFCLILRND